LVSNKERLKRHLEGNKEGIAIKEGADKSSKRKRKNKKSFSIFIEDGEKKRRRIDLVVNAQLPKISTYLKDFG